MSTGIGTGIAGDTFKAQTSTGSGIVPIPAVLTNEYSMHFDGVSEYLKTFQVPLLGTAGTGNWSISFWLKMVNISGVANQRVLAFGSGGTQQTQFYITNAGTIQLQGPWSDAGPLNTYSAADTWIHIIYRVDRSADAIAAGQNVGYAFNGGNFNNKNQTSFPTFDQTGSFFIGRNASTNNFNGNIDELAVWNKYLTDDECAAVYNGGTSVDLYSLGISANLQHWWRMGDPTGQTEYPVIPDQVTGGLSNNLVVNGTFEQTGPEIIQNGDFSELGSDQVTNGDFAEGDTDWTAAAGWAIANGAATCSSGNDNLSQLVGAVAGKTYQISVDVTLTSGTLVVDLGYDAAEPYTESISTSGTKTFYLKAVNTNSLRFYGGAFRGSVTNISVKQVDPNDNWFFPTTLPQPQGDWLIEEGKAVRGDNGGTNSSIDQTLSITTTQYKFSYTRNYTGGTGKTNIYVKTDGVNYVTLGEVTSTVVEELVVTGYFSGLFTGSMDWRVFGIDTWQGNMPNISVKEVLGNWTFNQGSALGGTSTVAFEEGVGYNGTTGCVFTGDAANTYIALNQTGMLTIGNFYELSFVAKRNGGAGTAFTLVLNSSTTSDVFTIASDTYQEYSVRFEAVGNDFVLKRGDLTDTSVIVDNIVVREITGYAAEMINMDSTNIEADAP